MRIFSSRKRVVTVVVATAAVIAISIAAFGYWTTGGTGTGSGATGTSTNVTVAQTSTVSAMTPGSPAQPLDFTITNGAATNQYVHSVTITITGVNGPNITVAHPCDGSDFTLVQPAPVNADLAQGPHAYSPSGASLAMVNKTDVTPGDGLGNQDGCKGATVALLYTTS